MRWLLVLAVCSCGGSEPPQRTHSVSPIATPTGPEDVVVAQVNGRPIYGSCVTAQSRGKTREAALDECVAFELLAQAADARGLSRDPDVVDATRAALVNREVELGFEQKYKTPADLKPVLDAFIERNRAHLVVRELRSSAYIRFNLPPKVEDPQAQWKIEALAQKLSREEGLLAPHLEAYAKAVDPKLEVADIKYFPKLGLALGYRDALFAIEEVGKVYPHAVRTQWGWDVILLTGVKPEKRYTREEAAEEAFPEVRRGYFTTWVDQIAKSLGVKITIDDKAVAKLDEGAK